MSSELNASSPASPVVVLMYVPVTETRVELTEDESHVTS